VKSATLHAVAVMASIALCVALAATPTLAAQPAPGFTIDSLASPTNFSAADNAQCEKTLGGGTLPLCDSYEVTVTDVGSRATDGSPVRIVDEVPAGVTVRRMGFVWSGVERLHVNFLPNGVDLNSLAPFCTNAPVECVFPGPLAMFPGGESLAPDDTLRMVVDVTVDESARSGTIANTARVSGGGAREAATARQNTLGVGTPAFGVSNLDFRLTGVDGARDTQAGDHPYELNTTIDLNDTIRPDVSGKLNSISPEDIKDVVFDLPFGLAASTLAASECKLSQLSSAAGCPPDTVVGHLQTYPAEVPTKINSPIYNLVPERGVPAEFGYVDGLKGSHVFYAHVVPTRSGYVLQTINPDIPQVPLSQILVTFYGDPAEKAATGNAPVPFFTNPTDCSGSEQVARIYMDSWQKPARFNADGTPVDLSEPEWARAESKAPAVTGCNALQFPAEIKAQPTTHEADKPSGMNFEIRLPQSETMGVPATPTLKKVFVTLPEGFTVDPSAGDGLGACSEAQIGWLGATHVDFSPAAPECPEASKIGSLELETPLVPGRFEGDMYLARQDENPFGATLAAYVVVDDPVTGVLIKIAGEFLPDPHTGRLTAVFDENPNLPFSDLQLHFFGGPRAELATPEQCGAYTVAAELTSWAFEPTSPDPGLLATPFDGFTIDEACPGGFSPSFTAGSTNLQAGAYTPFVASFSRSDTDQELAGLSVTLPPGLLANLTGVPLCSDAAATAAACPEASQVGTVLASTGPGPNPLQVPGRAYLTGAYNGGPYGLAVVVPAVAGPFDFGTVVVRQSIRIDPITAQVTDVSDPFPTIIDGIPLRLRRVDLTMNRPGGVHVQPDRLRKARVQREHHRQSSRCADDVERDDRVRDATGRDVELHDAVPGHQLPDARLQTGIQGLDHWEDLKGGWGEPERQAHLSQSSFWEPGEHQERQGGPPEAVAVQAHHPAEGVS
jgi:hypothetical protein